MAATGTASPKLAGMKFLVEEVLDSEGKGTVVRIGDQEDVGKPYALKIIKREGTADDAKIDQARAAVAASAKLGHPAALRYHDFRLRKKWLIVTERAEVLMEYVDGQALDGIEKLEIGPAVLIAHQIAAALAHMHRRGVGHGDLTAGHVMLTRSGQVKVLGYGRNLARGQADAVDEKADLYGFGATVYRVLTGRPARGGGEGGKISIPSALNPRVPARLNNLVVACLQSNPHKRPEGAFNVEQELKALADELGLDPSGLRGLARGRAATS